MIELLKEPWPWYVAGPLITLVMGLLLWFGGRFGLSSNLRTICAIGGAGKFSDFFKFNWKDQIWNLVFVLGTVIGGWVATTYLQDDSTMKLSTQVVADMTSFGIEVDGQGLLPMSLFGWEALGTLRGFVMIIVGGFLVGFGTRYAGGCTSGHAISGLSNLQVPSLIAVIGFFLGGLIMTYLFLPAILNL